MYNARYYDPALGRFLAADSMVPDPANPQSLNRYSYTLNNPLRYTDPSGHIHFLATAAIGGVIGGGLSLLTQITRAQSAGSAQTFEEAWGQVDWAEVAGATVAGIVAGATMGIVTPVVAGTVLPSLAASGASSAAVHAAGLGISIGAGGLSNILGGRAGAVTAGVVAEGLASRENGTEWNITGAYQGACDYGFWSDIQTDAIVGGAGGAFGYAFQTASSALGFAPDPQWRLQVHPDRINYARSVLTQQQAISIGATEVINEVAGNVIQHYIEKPIQQYY